MKGNNQSCCMKKMETGKDGYINKAVHFIMFNNLQFYPQPINNNVDLGLGEWVGRMFLGSAIARLQSHLYCSKGIVRRSKESNAMRDEVGLSRQPGKSGWPANQ